MQKQVIMAEAISRSTGTAQQQESFPISSFFVQAKSISGRSLVLAGILFSLGAWIGMAYSNGGMFLKEAVVSSVIISGALINSLSGGFPRGAFKRTDK
jgi:hypothetical protein